MLNDIRHFAIKNKYNLAIFLLYVIVCFISMFFHEIWRDEARVWFVLNNNYDFKTLFDVIRLDGHLYLWYLILLPFAKMGASYISMQIVSVILCSAAVLFFLVKSPFNYLVKILFVFSSGIVYFLPVIARPYALIPLFIFLLAYLYSERHNKPYQYLTVLILLSQTHCLTWGLCIICSFVFLIECIKKFIKEKNANFIIIPVIISIYYVCMFFIYRIVFLYNNWNPTISKTFFRFSINDIENAKNILQALYKSNTNPTLLNISLILFALIFFLLLKTGRKAALYLLISSSFIYYMLLKVWYGGILYQKIYLIVLLVVFCQWIVGKNECIFSKISQYIFTLFLLTVFFNPLFFNIIRDDILNTYTNTKEICELVNLDTDSDILVITQDYEGMTLDNFIIHKKNGLFHNVIENSNEKKYTLTEKDILTEYGFPKYIAVSLTINFPEELPYKKVLSAPNNKVYIYNSQEYYNLYKKIQ